MGRPKRKLGKALSTPGSCVHSRSESFSDVSVCSVLSAATRSSFLSLLMTPTPGHSILDKISTLLNSVTYTAHRHAEVQMLKETLSQAIHDIYCESLSTFTSDVQRIRCGQLFFTDNVKIQECQLLQVAMRNLLQIDESKEVYHLTFAQVNWFVDQLIRAIRALEGCSNNVLMASVTRAWNVTKVAAQRLDTFLHQLFKADKTVVDFTCMILNKQILIEKLRKEPIIIALNEKTSTWKGEDKEFDTDMYEGMSIDQIVDEIEEPKSKEKRPKRRNPDYYVDEFRLRLENEPVPLAKVQVTCSDKWLKTLQSVVMTKYDEAVQALRASNAKS